MRRNNGITLIALALTIIILLILAGVSIHLVFGSSGIVTRAMMMGETQKIGELKEKLELAKGPVALYNMGEVSITNYLKAIKEEGIVTDENIVILNDEQCRVILEEKYVFLIEALENNDIKITYEE